MIRLWWLHLNIRICNEACNKEAQGQRKRVDGVN